VSFHVTIETHRWTRPSPIRPCPDTERVGPKLQEAAPGRSDGLNPLGLRAGRSRKSKSLRRAGRVIPPNPTRPARSHLCPEHCPSLSDGIHIRRKKLTGWGGILRRCWQSRDSPLALMENEHTSTRTGRFRATTRSSSSTKQHDRTHRRSPPGV
jgi:hypothetical protein